MSINFGTKLMDQATPMPSAAVILGRVASAFAEGPLIWPGAESGIAEVPLQLAVDYLDLFDDPF